MLSTVTLQLQREGIIRETRETNDGAPHVGQRRIYVQAPRDEFERWLGNETQKMHWRSQHTEQDGTTVEVGVGQVNKCRWHPNGPYALAVGGWVKHLQGPRQGTSTSLYPAAVRFELVPVGDELQVDAHYYHSAVRPLFDLLMAAIRQTWPHMREAPTAEATAPAASAQGTKTTGKRGKLGPSDTTQERARICEEMKDNHPTWSRSKLAAKAMTEHPELGTVTEDTLKYDWKVMGWPWKRGERSR